MEKTGEGAKAQKLKEGDTLYSPYRKPSRRAPKGLHWEAAEWHLEKGYPYRWKLAKDEPARVAGTTHAAESAAAMERAEERSEEIARKILGKQES